MVVASPLVAPPSRPLVAPPSRPLVVILLRRPLVLSSSSSCAALSSSNRTGWLLRRLSSRHRLVFSSRRTLVLSSSSRCTAILSSHRAVWLLRRLSSRPPSRPLVVLSLLRHHVAVLRRLVVLWLPLVGTAIFSSRRAALLFVELTSIANCQKERGTTNTTTTSIPAAAPI